MYLCDCHVHSEYSYDAFDTIDAICSSAVERGLNEITITDHHDANIMVNGITEWLNVDAIKNEIDAMKAKYDGVLKVNFGIELGEGYEYPEYTKDVLSKYNFDFVIGSMHNLKGSPDFYFIDYTDMTPRMIEVLFEDYLEQTKENIEFGGFHTLAHLGYPLRYFARAGKPLDISKYKKDIDEILALICEKEVALEVNTKSLGQEIKTTLATPEMLKSYRNMGGKLITIGSDAHKANLVGYEFEKVGQMLRDIGYSEYTVFRAGRPHQVEL